MCVNHHVYLATLLLLLLVSWTQAIYHPGTANRSPKYKERVVLKPLNDHVSSTTNEPPVRVYSRGRARKPPPERNVAGRQEDIDDTTSSLLASRRPEDTARHAQTPTRHTDRSYTSSGQRTRGPKPGSQLPMGHTRAGDSQAVPGVLTCPEPNGLFPYIQDCSKFINCANTRPHLQSCGPGTLFNPATSTCEWPHAVTCATAEDVDITASHTSDTQGPPPHARNRQETPSHATDTQGPPPHARNRQETPSHATDTQGPPSGPNRGGGRRSSAWSFRDAVSESARTAADSVVGIFNDLRDKVEWTYQKTKDKGKRLLKTLGLKDSITMCPKPNGIFPYLKDCSKFINCWRGRPSLQRCAPGTLFNYAKGICDFPSKTVCFTSRSSVRSDTVSYVVPPSSGQKIRLRGGEVPWAGYVQVSGGRGDWRMVTDTPHLWTRDEASVVCRSLGFTRGAESASQGRTFGPVPGRSAGVRRVECEGHEENLLHCRLRLGTQEDLDKTAVGVRCLRNWVSECGENGVRWGDKCYYVDTSVLVTHAQAREFCSTKGARLLSITSQNESDFLSELLETLARDTVGLHTGGVRTQVFGDTFWLWQNSSTPPAPSLPFALWWPGWNVTVGVQQNGNQRVTDEDVKNGDVMSEESVTQCIVIRDNFPIQQGEGSNKRTTAPAEYFFWQLSDCAQKLHFVCETDKIDVGCIEDRGMTYAGTANITVDGEPCLPWKDPHVQLKIRDFTQTRGLTNNYCANPDGDDIPWCFTSVGRANFCDIPRCERKETHHEIVENVCPSHMFACASGGCIHQEWQCDGQKDCNDNSDEQECQDYSEEFTKLANHRLVGEEVEKWLYTLRVACAARCVQAKNFICMSFNYEQASETCILSKGNVGLSGGLVSSGGWEYHEMRKLVVNCSNMFVCGDGKCIDAAQNCDGRRDCKKGEDEMDCEDKVNFEVRLANGSDVHEGRVEVKAFRRWGGVCHDMWGELEGDVVCRQLGFSLGAREVLLNSHFGSSRGQYLMDDLNCQGNEASLAECDFGGWGVHDCQASEGAGVRCYKVGDECSREQWQCSNGRCIGLPYLCDTVDDCHDGSDEERGMCQAPLEVRLVDGKDMEEVARGEGELKKRQGRVEVRYLGIWGTVCDDDITLEEGHVLCRMMGWAGASHVYKNNSFGAGVGMVWLDDVKCLGYEASVVDCQHLPWGQTNCDHTEDVGLQCSDIPITSTDTTDSFPPDGPLPESLPSTCGLREVDDNPTTSIVARVVSGHTPPPGAHPWMVAINLLTRTGPTQWCGGAVLGEEYVLTAGHCVFKYPATTYLLKIGDFNTQEEEEEEQEFRVSAVVLHPEYDKGPYLNNDIALLKVEKKNGRGIQFGRFVQPLCMVPSRWKYPPYLNCTVAGWGSLGVTLGYSKVLQSALLPILPEETCEADHVYGPARLTQGMYCAGHMEGGIDTCQGDSGGPMVCFVEGRYTAVGITSWGHGCARPNKPGVYTKLSRYIPWIYSNMR